MSNGDETVDDLRAENSKLCLDLARLRRLNRKLSADATVLTEELDEIRLYSDRCDAAEAERETTAKAYRELAASLREKLDHLEPLLVGKQRRLEELEGENGELEVRLARALGRTFVVAKEDEVASLVSSLVRIRDMVGPMKDLPLDQRHRSIDEAMVEGKLRGIVGIAAEALKRAGVREEVRTKERSREEGSTSP